MATISITIPDAALARVVDAIAGNYKYQDTIPDPSDSSATIPNPETKNQFAKRMTAFWAKENLKAWEANEAADTARDTAIADADLIDIT